MDKNTKKRFRQLTILHSNDLHASFITNQKNDMFVGGFPLLAGFVEQCRTNHPKRTMYLVAGDLFSGNLIDYDSKGVRSVKLLNDLAPDAICIGNHSVDHSFLRLTFLEHLCNFPVLCSNLYIKEMNRPFFKPYTIIKKNGIKILLIGIVTDEIMRRAGKDEVLGTYAEHMDPLKEIDKIINEVDTSDVDLKIILSHLGYKNDIELAKKIKSEYGINMIIGGHSHTKPDKAVEENGIIIVQAGNKSEQIGRFEIKVDTEAHKMVDWRWDLLPIDSGHGTKLDIEVSDEVTEYYNEIVKKYSVELITLEQKLVKDEFRYKENVIGNFFADLLKEMFNLDVCLIGSGSLRTNELGEKLTKLQLREMYSVNEVFYKINMTGSQIKHAMKFTFEHTPKNQEDNGEYYQVDKGCCFWYYANDAGEGYLSKAEVCGKEIEDERIYSVGIEDYHYFNLKEFMDIDLNEIEKSEILTVDTNGDIEEYLLNHQNYKPSFELEERTKIIRNGQ